MENTLDIFESNELCCELESRGFTVFDSTVDESVQEALSELTDGDLKDELERRDFYVYDSEQPTLSELCDDNLSEVIECVQSSGAGIFIENPPKSIDFRMTDCKGLIEDIVKRRGWNWLYELLIKC